MEFMKINKEKFCERTLISTQSALCCLSSIHWSQKSATLCKKNLSHKIDFRINIHSFSIKFHQYNNLYFDTWIPFHFFNCHFMVYESDLNCLNSLWSFQLLFEDKGSGVLCFLTFIVMIKPRWNMEM